MPSISLMDSIKPMNQCGENNDIEFCSTAKNLSINEKKAITIDFVSIDLFFEGITISSHKEMNLKIKSHHLHSTQRLMTQIP